MELEFLTRKGCSNTPTLLENLEQAEVGLGNKLEIEVVDQGDLAAADPRTGYPTPTILYKQRDIFGLPDPQMPYPEPG